MLNKPFDQITADDILELCRNAAYENLTLEFKRELPSRDGRRPDPWMQGGNFSEYARDRLFREIVAFANAQGGTLILGIDETDENPPRAAAVSPIPRVHDLASRLEDAARACIDPPLGSLQVRGITVENDGSGVVLFRTMTSPSGPHRVAAEGHCYIRRGSSSVRMTMREIQDLTLDLARGSDRLDAIFAARARGFIAWLNVSELEMGGFRITAAPVGSLPVSPRVAGQTPGFANRFRLWLDGKNPIEAVIPIHLFNPRPILRGQRSAEERDDFAFQFDILDNGVVDIWVRHAIVNGRHLFYAWVLAAYILVLNAVRWLRTRASAPDWEFGIEVEFGGVTAASTARSNARIPLSSIILRFGDRAWSSTVSVPTIQFPRMRFQSEEETEDLLNFLYQDLLDAAGDQSPIPRLMLSAVDGTTGSGA
jgi:hypothetical protein